MGWVMSLIAGLGIGYFIYQSMTSGKSGGNGRKITGRLHKSIKDKKICGVCAGIAEYLKVDPTIVRFIFAMMVLGWGTGIMAYFLCALILPAGDAEDEEEDEEETEEEETTPEEEFYTNSSSGSSSF